MKVAVIVDDLDPERRRRCFWEEQLECLPDTQYQVVSLLDHMDRRCFFNVYEYDVIIFNWCVLDGAVMYSSDRVQDIVCFFDDHFKQFVRRGGILIMENQPKRWRPSQKAYDVLLPGEVAVRQTDIQVFGSKVHVNPRFKNHPLLVHLPRTLHSDYSHPLSENWFPEGSTSAKSLHELHPTKLYSGDFQRWRPEWLPVLQNEDSSSAVLLLKTDGQGLWVVSTMYLASGNLQELIETLILGFRRNALSVQSYHARQKRHRLFNFAGAALLVILLGLAAYLILDLGLINANLPFGSTVLGDVISSVLFAALVALLALSRRTLGRLLRASLNR